MTFRERTERFATIARALGVYERVAGSRTERAEMLGGSVSSPDKQVPWDVSTALPGTPGALQCERNQLGHHKE